MSEDEMDVDGLTTDELRDVSSTSAARAGDAAVLEMLDARKRGRTMAVPTDDVKVRQRLRDLGEPVTIFGERRLDRRERLREVLVKKTQESGGPIEEVKSESEESEEEEEEFFTEGSQDLLHARQNIARFSLIRAAKRIALQRMQATIPLSRILSTRKELYAPLRTYTNLGSQIGDTRPISIVRFSPNGKLLGTGSWSGGVKLWEIPSAKQRMTLRGHNDKVGGLAWHPQATLSQSETEVNLATGAADSQIHLWNLAQDRPISTLSGHAARVARVDFHPSGSYLASASFDGTWRLWDVATQKELLVQEGHSKEVYAVSFQSDGALLASGGLDALGRIWDLRTGRTAMILDGHAREILSIDFNANGFVLATASGDDFVKIWDLRQLKNIYSIPAHTSTCSDVRFFRSADDIGNDAGRDAANGSGVVDGVMEADDADERPPQSGYGAKKDLGVALPKSSSYLATSGYDGLVKIWSADDWQLLRSLSGDAGKAMSIDISSDGQYLASGEWSRTFKLWGTL
jgi:U4/U6 small nuclear ribonucleoprotein PRP4